MAASNFLEIIAVCGCDGNVRWGGLGYGGVAANFFIGDNWIINPNFAVGAYANGGGKDLGQAIEFRSGAEFAYQFENESRLGIVFNHISNASLGGQQSWNGIIAFNLWHSG